MSCTCSTLSSSVKRSGSPPRRAKGASSATTTAPWRASSAPYAVICSALPGIPCISRIPANEPAPWGTKSRPVARWVPRGLRKLSSWIATVPSVPSSWISGSEVASRS
jgi:hypothetical protein